MGDGVFHTSTDHTAQARHVEVMVLAPVERVRVPPLQPWVSWLGRTADGDLRVATLSIGAVWPKPSWAGSNGRAIPMRRAPVPDGTRRYELQGMDGPLTSDQVLAAVRASACVPVLGIDPDDPWTAQELFDLCAELGCELGSPPLTCWDLAHPPCEAR